MAWSGPTFLSEDANDSVGVTSVVLTGVTAAVGALVVVTGRVDGGGGGVTGFTATDSAGNTYIVDHNGTNTRRGFIISSVLTNALSAGSITVARTGTTNITSYSMQAVGYTGAATGTWEDTAVRAFSSGNGYSTTVTGGTAANAGDLVISNLGYNLAGGGMSSFTEASGWTTARTTSSTNLWSNQAYKVNSGTAGLTYNPTPSGGAPGGSTYTLLQTAFIAASGGGDVTVSATGVSATAAVGTGSPATAVSGSGVSATGNVGTGAPATAVSGTGVAATSAVGNVTPATAVGATGVSATGQVGTVTVQAGGDITVSATGVSATSQVGTVIPNTAVSGTGVSASSAVGSVTPALAVLGIGVAANSQVGNVTGQATGNVTVSVTGVQAAGQIGTVTVSGGDALNRGGHFIPLTEKQLRELRKRERKQRKDEEARLEARREDAESIGAAIRAELLPRTIQQSETVNLIENVVNDDDDDDLEVILMHA